MRIIILITLFFSSVFTQSMNANLTLYKNGFTMVKQPAFWNVPTGKSQITYSLIPNQLYPDTPFLSVQSGLNIISQRINNNIFSSDKFFKSRLGSMVEAYLENGKSVYGKLIEYNHKAISIQSKAWLKSISRDELMMLTLKEKVIEPQFRPKLEWDVHADYGGFLKGKILYMTGGVEWKAVYRLITQSNGDGARLISEALISNETDLNYEDATLKLVEGDLHKSSSGIPIRFAPKSIQSMRTGIESSTQMGVEEIALGDYYEYPLGDPVSLMSGETVTMTLYAPKVMSFKKTYIFENRERQKKEEPLVVELEITNTKENNLFIPLPAGKVEIYIETSDGNIEFIGEDNINQIPKGEKAKLIAGRAFDVIGIRKIMDYDRQRKSEEASIDIEIKNKKDQEVVIKVVEHISGDWVIKESNKQYIKEEAGTIYFPLTISANDSEKILYTYKKEWK
jgi:hypothetical protein